MADSITFDLSALDKLARDFANIPFDKDNTSMMREISAILYEATGKIFRNEGAYGGHQAWRKGVKTEGSTLVKSGAMRRAIGVLQTKEDWLFYGISGSVIPYASKHQYGWGGMPLREFIFVTEQDKVIFGKIATEHFRKKIIRSIQ